MPTVYAVAGPIDTADLGFTLMHEHIIVESPGVKENFPIVDREAEIDKAAAKLKDVMERGVDTLVDLTPGDWRDIPLVKDVVARSGMQVIGHSGDTEDTNYLRKLCERGSYIGMDRFGIDIFLENEKRVATIAKMCGMGYAEKMVLSHDAACYFGWVDPPLREKIVPNWHFNHIPDHVLPALLAAGVTEDQIHAMTVDNPRRIFEKQGAY